MKTITSAIIAIGSIVSGFEMHESKFLAVRSGLEDWPAIKYPFNFLIQGSYYTFNNETNQLEPYQNLTADQYLDS